jgi:predicted nucleotidyltransferase
LAYNGDMSQLAVTSEKIEELVRRIVEAVHPLRIILFGSAARGEMGPHSDLDVMVVMPEGTDRIKTAGFIYTQLSGLMAPVDVLVSTEAELEWYGNARGTVHRDVVREGRTIYAADAG